MPRFKTTFNGYAAKFSPFVENRVAVATAQNFGIIGNGRLHILEVSQCVLLLPSTQHVRTPAQHSGPCRRTKRTADARWACGDSSV